MIFAITVSQDQVDRLVRQAITNERKRCAKLASGYDNGNTEQGSVARAIASGILAEDNPVTIRDNRTQSPS